MNEYRNPVTNSLAFIIAVIITIIMLPAILLDNWRDRHARKRNTRQ